ncbi:MAG: glycosyl hydrolase, partial [Bacteroidetes bacterium]
NNFSLHYYFDASVKESNGEIYNDDGETANAFEKGEYELLQFEAEIKNRWLEIEFEAEVGKNYSSENKTIDLVIHNIDKQPKRIKGDGKKISVVWNSENKTLSIPVNWDTNKELEINIKFKK